MHLGGASDLLDEWLRNNAENYREKRKTADAEETPPSNFGSLNWPSTFAGGTLPSPKPPRPVENVITRWETKTRTGWTNSMTTLAGAVGHPVTFSAVNSAKGFLSNPLMIVTIEGAYGVEDDRATDIDRDAVLPSVESRRRDPGIVPVQAAMRHLRPIAAQREMQWTNTETGVEVRLTPEALRPETPWSPTRPDLVVIARNPDADELRVTWSLTAKGINDRLTGEATLRVDRDMGARSLLVTYLNKASKG